MRVELFRKIHDSKVISVEKYVYGMSITYILRYADGRSERIKYLDKSIDKDLNNQ
mgnify:CR=1 FL=1